MLVPKIEKQNGKEVRVDEIIIDSILEKESFYDVEILFSDKAKNKFVKRIERIIRSSFEYRNYIGILKNELNLTKCTFLPEIDISSIRVSLEFHHYPFTLYDLVAIEVDRQIFDGKKFIDPFEVADTIMALHYKNLVGLVPLSATVHELVHAGKKFVNKKFVYGNYEKYMDKYAKYINDEYNEKISQINDLSAREDDGEDIDGNILDLNFLKVTVNDIERPKKINVEVPEIA